MNNFNVFIIQVKKEELQNKALDASQAAREKASNASQAAQNKAGDATSTAQEIKDQASHLLQQACMQLQLPSGLFLSFINFL